MNNEHIVLDGINLNWNENEPLNEIKKVPNNLEKFSSVNTIKETHHEKAPKRVNLFEKKNKWMVNKKDSEKTIVNSNDSHVFRELESNQESSSSSLFDKYDGPTFSPQESLVNDDDFKIDQILNSETLISDETCRTSTTEKSEPVTHSDTLVNDDNFRNILIEPMEGSINSLDSLYKFSPVVDEIIDETGALSDPDHYFEPKEDCYYLDNNNSSIQIDDNGIVYSDDSGSYDNIFNYNSDIILSDDEDIRKAKVDELYNEAMLLKNLDNNAFSFMSDEPYPDYYDESVVDNTESADCSFLEREANRVNVRGSNASDRVDLRLHDLSDWNGSSDSFNSLDYAHANNSFNGLDYAHANNSFNGLDYAHANNSFNGLDYAHANNSFNGLDYAHANNSFNGLDYAHANPTTSPTPQHFENLSVKFNNTPYVDQYQNFQNFDGNHYSNGSDFVSIDDDAIYVISDMNDDHLANQNIPFHEEDRVPRSKKRVTFDDNVRVKSIERIEIQDEIQDEIYLKNYLKLKAGFQKLKRLFTLKKKKKQTKVEKAYQGEIPIVVIEYIDDVYDEYNRKEVIYFGKNYPKITIDFSEGLDDSIAIDEHDVFDCYDYGFDFEERTDSKLYHNKFPVEPENNDISSPKSILKNDKVIAKPSEDSSHSSNSNRNTNDFENIPSYLRDPTPQKKKEKQKKARKFIDKVMNMERNYYNPMETSKGAKEVKEVKEVKGAKEVKEVKEVKGAKEVKEVKEVKGVVKKESPQEPIKELKEPKEPNEKKTKSKSYIKNVYKSFKNSIINDNLRDTKLEKDEKNKSNVNISNVNVMDMKLENLNLKLLLEEEEKDTDSFQEILNLFENDNSKEVLENDTQKPESHNENLVNDKSSKPRSSSVVTDEKTSVNEKEENLGVINGKNESLKKKRKRSWSLFSLFKKSSHLRKSSSSSLPVENYKNDENTNLSHEISSLKEKDGSIHEVVNKNGHTYIIHKDINNGYTEVIHEDSRNNKPVEEIPDPTANSSTSINYELDLSPPELANSNSASESQQEKEQKHEVKPEQNPEVEQDPEVKPEQNPEEEQDPEVKPEQNPEEEQDSEVKQDHEVKQNPEVKQEQEQKPEIKQEESLAVNLDKMDSSLTETDILAKQVSKISSLTEMNQSSLTLDYTQPQNQISLSSLNLKSSFMPQNSDQTILIQNNIMVYEDYPHSFQKVIRQEKQLKLKEEKGQIVMPTSKEANDDLKKPSKPSPSPQLQPQQQGQPKKLDTETKNNNPPPSTPQTKTFKPVVLPIDNENNFNKVDTIEVIDEYVIKCHKPFIIHTDNGEDQEVNEIVIEDEITE